MFAQKKTCLPLRADKPIGVLGQQYVFSIRLAVHLLHVGDELEHLVRVANLIVVP